MNASETNSQVTLDERLVPVNYHGVGFPFPAVDSDSVTAAARILWNADNRFWGLGTVSKVLVTYNNPGAGTVPNMAGFPDQAEVFPDGANVSRALGMYYIRLRPRGVPLTDTGRYPGVDEDHHFMEALFMVQPQDVLGTDKITFRPVDPTDSFTSWVYAPSMRRVRRFSGEDQGSPIDFVRQEFFVFSDPPTVFDLTSARLVVTTRWIAHASNAQHEVVQLRGQNAALLTDGLELRPSYVIRVEPIQNGLAQTRFLLIDHEHFGPLYNIGIDHAGNVARIVTSATQWSEDIGHTGLRFPMDYCATVYFPQTRQSTHVIGYQRWSPKGPLSDLLELFQTSTLGQGKPAERSWDLFARPTAEETRRVAVPIQFQRTLASNQ